MKYICAQPATQYFGWQIDVMLHSFVTVGINLKDVHIVCAIQNKLDPYFSKLQTKYSKANFFYYKDLRKDKTYISSIRPNILKQHFSVFSELSSEAIFYHDCDIALTKPLEIGNICENNICYMSDTISYIGHDYIISKGEEVLDEMCNIVGIDKKIVEQNQQSSGGAQYLLKNIDKYFWYDVEKDSSRLFKEISKLNKDLIAKNGKDYNPLQIWCADMWGVLWNLWKRNKQTKVIPEMDFSWSVGPKKEWHEKSIYHNAGVTADNGDLFFKGKWIHEIPPTDLNIKKDSCSYMYYNLLRQTL